MTLDNQIETLGFTPEENHLKNAVRTLFAKIMSSSKINDSNFSFSMFSNDSLNLPGIDNNAIEQLTQDNKVAIIENLLKSGFIKEVFVFWEDGDTEFLYGDLSEEDASYLKKEAEKSRNARGLDAQFYESKRGDIYHPESGVEGFDPAEHLTISYVWTNKLIRDPEFVLETPHDIGIASKELITPELKAKILLRAREIAIERLAKLDLNQ